MAVLEFQTTVSAPLEAVWAFHADARNLAATLPPESRARIESADAPLREGSRIVIVAKGPLGAVRWVARIVEHVPPHPVVFGQEARFVDVQEAGPFKSWRHEHEFEHAGEKSTRLVDRITYRVGWGPIGWLADVLFVRHHVRRMFRYRHEVLRERFGADSV